MLYNLLMTLLMTVIATAVGTAQTVVHSSLSPLSSPPSLRTLLLLLPFGLSLLSVRVPDIAFSACCSAPTACRGISKWQFWVFRLFDCSVYRSDSTPLPAPLNVTTFHIFGIGIFRFGCARVEFIGNFCRLHLQSID